MRQTPPRQGLYDPSNEHDACGVAFVVDVSGKATSEITRLGLEALSKLQHRGALGSEENTGDGAGILIQVPDRFLRDQVPFELPDAGSYATGLAFLPRDATKAEHAIRMIAKIASSEDLSVLGWRTVPIDASMLGNGARSTMPSIRQVFVAPLGTSTVEIDSLERSVFMLRKRIEHEVEGVYFPSLSAKTLVYKGMLTTDQLDRFYPDLTDPRVETALALVHSRFSTNTFPSWPLAHPYRYVSHNGEINTVKGNRNWMRARQTLLASPALPGGVDRIMPVVDPDGSDSASFDEVLELLHMGGRSLPHSILMMIPEAWENHDRMPENWRAFYEYHASLMEPWDGPASIAFTDGTLIGAIGDRNGLRPSRYWVTDTGIVAFASEVGVIDVEPSRIVAKGRLEPGRMFLVDTSQGRIVDNDEIKNDLAAQHPYRRWLDTGLVKLGASIHHHTQIRPDELRRAQQTFGYTHEELDMIVRRLAIDAKDPIGSMGNDTPIAVLSNRSRLLYDYFHQLFAQVTNPPLDAMREELVTSLRSRLGPEMNLLATSPDACRQVILDSPILDDDRMRQLRDLRGTGAFRGNEIFDMETVTITGLYETDGGGAALRDAIADACDKATDAVDNGAAIIIVSDKGSNERLAPIPSLLATSAVHSHLVRMHKRSSVGLVVESGDARGVHHICLLVGYGANAVNPYTALASIRLMADSGDLGAVSAEDAQKRYMRGLGSGMLKVMSKMGISTVASYTGAQIFEAIGLSASVIDDYFDGTSSRIGGIDLDVIAGEVRERHQVAYARNRSARAHRDLDFGGHYKWRREGEHHAFNPATVQQLQRATATADYEMFKSYTFLVNTESERRATLRGMFDLVGTGRDPIPLDEVESVGSIMRRFSTGAMSYGSISKEAHETLAIAMNRIGAKSNTGEGGEDADRFTRDDNGDLRRSAIKQVASGRFGVTSEYLVNADDIQIKMAQGAKPGEGGHLPGKKVYPWIAKTRSSTPGVGLISPPPHHDIYSIEDLAQLIHDLKNANPLARIHVKLVSEVGVGTVAAGVSKGHADVVLISGHDGGTGASPLTSVKHAGAPWELGLAETQQTLLLNGLRDRIVVQTDGQLKTGRDVIVAALLGAEEFGFATAPLVVMGCVMMRVCHKDTCPVGIATQNPALRERFAGRPEDVVTFFSFIAQEVRELLAKLGFRSLDEAVGRTEALDFGAAIDHWKASGIDLSPILHVPDIEPDAARHCTTSQNHGLDKALDVELIERCADAIEHSTPIEFDVAIANVNRTVGTMLGNAVTRRHGGAGLADGTIKIGFVGSAGQSFGAFVPSGITLHLTGDANDYLAKGLSGGRIIVRKPDAAPFVAEENIIAGNVVLYGATSGDAFINGVVGERFCVRNSGADAVVEGVGDHGCEYMTGGTAVVLGRTGRNFGAGMSGGVAYVYDPSRNFAALVNHEMVELDPLDDDDRAKLRRLVCEHRTETGSALAGRLLADWDASIEQFVKVIPKDYKRVLEAIGKAQAAGLSIDEAVMEAAHG